MAISHDIIIRLVNRDRVRLLAYIAILVRDEHAAEDILQEVTIDAIEKTEQIESEEHLAAWMRKASRYAALNFIRDRKAKGPLLEPDVLDSIEAHWDESASSDLDERYEALSRCVSQLTPRSQEVIKLRYVDNLSGVRLATKLGQTVGGTYVAISRIHKALEKCLNKAALHDASIGKGKQW